MTREEAKELFPIIQAFAEGKKIEYSTDGENWMETVTPTWNSDYVYRIKPEPTYRPFKNENEYFNTILNNKKLSSDIFDKDNTKQKYSIETFILDKKYDRMLISTVFDFEYICKLFTSSDNSKITKVLDLINTNGEGIQIKEITTGKIYKVKYIWTGFGCRVLIEGIFTLPEAYNKFVFSNKTPFGVPHKIKKIGKYNR